MSEYTENQLRYRRSKGVSKAWEREREMVRQGRGTREWTVKQQKELLDTGRVKGFQGHHMLSVSKYPEQADNPKNIQFLSTTKENNEHLAAHKGDYKIPSEWRYNVKTGKTSGINPEKPRAMNSYELKDKAIDKRGYTHYAAEKDGAKKSPAEAYKSGRNTTSSEKKSTPAKKYSNSQNAPKQYNRTMSKPAQKRSQGNQYAQTSRQSSGQKR